MISRVTVEGMVESQPGTSVSYSYPGYPEETVRLNVSRCYKDLKNKVGGRGVHKRLDCDGMTFSCLEEAERFALSRGYLREFFSSPKLRQQRVDYGYNPVTKTFDGPNPPLWAKKKGMTKK